MIAACGGPAATASTPGSAAASQATSAIVEQAAGKLRAGMSSNGPYALLLSVGDGQGAEATAAALRAELRRDPRVTFSKVSGRTEPPVPDPSSGTGHVNAVSFKVEPWPNVVVRVSESGGSVFIAAREPGTDPLGPPASGWAWVLQAKLE